jgi:lysophospholipid acyltransferase (LPLAT)-like uncharacterized protein
MFKKLRNIARTRLAGATIYWMVRLYCATFRLKIENETEWLDYLEEGGRILICCWHQQFFVGVRVFNKYRKYRPPLMSSRSLDGQIAAGVAQRSGFYTVWGSSSRGGGTALKEMINRIKQHRLAAHIMDGPRGPAGIVKAGVIAIAHGADAAIVPAYARADRAWYMHSWDKFMVPKPFARVTVNFCPQIKLPPAKNKADFENQRQMLETVMRPYLYL